MGRVGNDSYDIDVGLTRSGDRDLQGLDDRGLDTPMVLRREDFVPVEERPLGMAPPPHSLLSTSSLAPGFIEAVPAPGHGVALTLPDSLELLRVDLDETGEALPSFGDQPRMRGGRPVLPPGTRVGERYTLGTLLGQGGMADVYRADDHETGTEIALKLLDALRGNGSTARARFLQEMTLYGRLTHPLVPVVYDFGDWNGRLFLSMELLHGHTLRDELDRIPGAALDLRLVASVGRGIARALHAAHKAGIVHRDVKPANIFLTDGPPGLKLLDFGVAKPLLDDAGLSATGTVPGTPAYVAPELLKGKASSPACDLWALGVVLYEMTTGRRPFASNHLPTLVRTICHVDPMPPTRHNPKLPPAVERLILRLLSREPLERPRTAESIELMLADLPR